MAEEPSLIQFFGANVSQTPIDLIIRKSDLVPQSSTTPPYQFTPEENNTSEQLALALFLNWMANQDRSAASQMVISGPDRALVNRGGIYANRYRFSVEVFIDDTSSSLPSPDDV